MKLLLDEMYPPAIAEQLRTRGVDAVSIHDPVASWLRAAPDEDVLAAATAGERTLVTEDVDDFRHIERLLFAAGGSHAGIAYTTNHRFPRGEAATLGRLVEALSALARSGAELRGRSTFLEPVER